MNIFSRLVLTLCGIALVTALVISLVFNLFMDRIATDSEHRQLTHLFNILEQNLDQEADRALSMAALVAHTPEAARALAEEDRETLLALYGPTFETLRDQYGVQQFQFNVPPATSFLRVHKPEKYGDDLSSFRRTVVEANTRRTTVEGLEHGVAGLGMRGVMPISYEGNHVGTVEFGMSFGEPFFKAFDKANDVRVGLFLPSQTGTFETFANTADRPLIEQEDMETALSGETVVRNVQLGDLTMAVMAQPVRDFSDTIIGVATIAMDISPFLAQAATARWLAIGGTAGTLVLALLLGTWMAMTIATPVQRVTTILGRLAKRDFSGAIPVITGKATWEIPRMLASLSSLRDTASQLDQADRDLNERLSEVQAREAALATAARDNLRGVVTAAVQANEAIVTLARVSGNVHSANVQSQTMASAVEELVASTHEISSSSDLAAEQAENTRGAANHGVTGSDDAVRTMEGIHSAVRDAAERVDTLAQASTQIGEIVQQIEDIADQTNLLALNATIEAARAGDAGKGFAVVANEVKSLANQTARATEDIRNRIDTLRREMDSIVSAMEKGASAVENGRSVVTDLGDHLGTIAGGIGQVTDRMQEIASILTQQSQAAGEIAQGTNAMADLSKGNKDELDQALQAMDTATGTLNEQVSSVSKTGGAMVLVEVAKNDHVVFKKRVVDSVMGRTPWREIDIPDHKGCRLGKWSSGVTDPSIRNHPAFRALEKPHADVHRFGREAVRLATQNDLDGALRAVEDLHRASKEVIALLTELSKAVEEADNRPKENA